MRNKFLGALLACCVLLGVAATVKQGVNILINNRDQEVPITIQKAGSFTNNVLDLYQGGTRVFSLNSNGAPYFAAPQGARSGLGLSELTTNTAAQLKTAVGIQTGSIANSTNSRTITFGTAFSSAPNVFITLTNAAGSNFVATAISITTTDFVAVVGSSTNFGGRYLAIGPP